MVDDFYKDCKAGKHLHTWPKILKTYTNNAFFVEDDDRMLAEKMLIYFVSRLIMNGNDLSVLQHDPSRYLVWMFKDWKPEEKKQAIRLMIDAKYNLARKVVDMDKSLLYAVFDRFCKPYQ
jgi:hypothetical protein